MSNRPDTAAVAQDLTAIVDLATHLAVQAVDNANDHLMPGGLAMVALAGVANREAWAYRQLNVVDETGALRPADDEETWEPPLQTLLFWSEDWRRVRNRETDRRPTIASEADFIRRCLEWALENEPHFEDFAADVHAARRRLEDLLHDGRRNKRGVPCLNVGCQGDLVRYSRDRREPRHCSGHEGVCTWPHRRCALHDRGGLVDEWRCPSCDRRYSGEDYARAVHQANVAHGEYLTLEDTVQRTGVSRGTIQGWASRGHVRKRKHTLSGRMTYCVTDIVRRAAAADVAL